MKNVLKSSLSIFLAITIIFSSAYVGLGEVDFSGVKFVNPFAVKSKAASSGTCGDNLTWTLDDNGVLTISGKGNMTNYHYYHFPWYSERSSINNVIINSGVTSIGDSAFSDCTILTSIEIPDSVTSIDDSAFYKCTSLSSVTIPDSVTSIGDYAFYGCTSLTSITIADSVTSIGNRAFSFTAYSNNPVNWENDVLYIGNHLISVDDTVSGDFEIKAGTKSISISAFSNCLNIVSITIPDSVTSIGDGAFTGCTSLTSVTIPDSVTSIGDSAFSSCINLTSITIPNSVTSIGDSAFSYCRNLTSITIPDSVASMGNKIFDSCTSLEAVDIGGGVTSIVYASFANCTNLASVTIPENVKSIGNSAFYCCSNLVNVETSDNLKAIGQGAFENCSKLTSVTLPTDMTNIECLTFSGCDSLKTITIPGNVTSIDSGAFRNCTGLTSIEIPDDVTSIENNAFSGCTSLASIEFPNGVTNIGFAAFSDCLALTTIAIPGSVTFLGNCVFEGCNSLTSITVDGDNKNYSSINGVLYDKNKTTVIQYPAGNSSTSYIIPDDVINIGENAFKKCNKLETVIIPDSVTCIEDSAFSDCTSLISIEIPDSVKSIDWALFAYCTSLESVTLPDSITSIDDYAFTGCTSLTSVIIPDSVTKIGYDAFSESGLECVFYTASEDEWNNILIDSYENDLNGAIIHYNGTEHMLVIDAATESTCIKAGLSEGSHCGICGYVISPQVPVTAPHSYINGVCTMCSHNALKFELNSDNNSYSLTDCETHLTGDLIIPETYNGMPVSNIGEAAFGHCENLTSITIPDSVKSIGGSAFSWCTGLTSIIIPDNVTSLDSYVFSSCSNLTTLTIGKGVTSIGDDIFEGCHNLTDIYYNSCRRDWQNIDINDYDDFNELTIHYTLTGLENFLEFRLNDDGESYSVDSCDDWAEGGIVIPSTYNGLPVTKIDAIFESEYITSITIPESVTYIRDEAFTYCHCITNITIDERNEHYCSVDGVLFNKAMTVLIGYPRKSEKKFYSIPYGVTKIDSAAFYYCENLLNIIIPDSVTEICESAFYYCTSLECVKIGMGIENIGDFAFDGCDGITDVYYYSSRRDWNNIYIGDCNQSLMNARIHYIHVHASGEWAVEQSATCNEDGMKYKRCTDCFEILQTEVIPATGHTESDWIVKKEATVYKAGSKHKECTECGEVLKTAKISQHKCSKPVLKKVYNANSYVKVTWGTVKGADLYRVYRMVSGGEYEYIGSTKNKYFNDKNAPAGKTCRYRIRAKNEAGYSEYSASLAIKHIDEPTLKSIKNSAYGVLVKWNKVTGAEKYNVYRKVNGGEYKYIGATSKTYYTDKTAKSGTKYYYAIRAKRDDSISSQSASLSKLYLDNPTLNTPSSSSKGIALKWSKVTGAEGYMVYRRTTNGSYKLVTTEKGVSNVTFRDTTAKKGTKYYYKVKAYYSKTYSAYSNTKSITDKY